MVGVQDIDAAVSVVAEGDSRAPLLGGRPEYESLSALGAGIPGVAQSQMTRQIYMGACFGVLLPRLHHHVVLSGTGIMYINDVGSTSLALFAESNPNYDEVEASKRQVAQVSTLSVGNFVGRLLLGDGPISDLIRNQFRLPRAYCLCIVSSLFVVSQALAIEISSIRTLWVATALLGVAYGGLFGALPTIVIDRFGLAHLSENWRYVTLAPLIGGNVFSIMLGRDLDGHTTPCEVTNLFLDVKPVSF